MSGKKEVIGRFIGSPDDWSGSSRRVVGDDGEMCKWNDFLLADMGEQEAIPQEMTGQESDPHIEVINLTNSDDENTVSVENVINNRIDVIQEQKWIHEKCQKMVNELQNNLQIKNTLIGELKQKLIEKDRNEEKLKDLVKIKNQILSDIGSKIVEYLTDKARKTWTANYEVREMIEKGLAYGSEKATIGDNEE